VFDSCSKDFICGILTRADNWTSHPRSSGGFVVIKPEDRQLLADFVNNLTKEQRSQIFHKLLKTLSTTKNILNEEEMEKFREQLDGDLAKNAQGRANAA
jgi:hypothetical protein